MNKFIKSWAKNVRCTLKSRAQQHKIWTLIKSREGVF